EDIAFAVYCSLAFVSRQLELISTDATDISYIRVSPDPRMVFCIGIKNDVVLINAQDPELATRAMTMEYGNFEQAFTELFGVAGNDCTRNRSFKSIRQCSSNIFFEFTVK